MSGILSGLVPANVESSGVSKAYIALADGHSGAYYQLHGLEGGQVKVTDYFKPDSLGRGRVFAKNFQFTCNVMQTGKASMLKLLHYIAFYAPGSLDIIVNGLNGTNYSSANITGAGTNGVGMGVEIDLTATGGMNGHRYVKFTFERDILVQPTDEWTLFTNAAPALGAQGVSDVLYPMGTTTLTNPKAWNLPAGITKMQFCVTGSGNIADAASTLGLLAQSGNFHNIFTGGKDALGRTVPRVVDITCEVDAMQASTTELQLMAGQVAGLDHKVTFADGTTFVTVTTAPDLLGLNTEYTLNTDVDKKSSIIKYTSTGMLPVNPSGAITTVYPALWV